MKYTLIKVATSVAGVSLLATLLASPAFATTIEVEGNGSHSTNTVHVDTSSSLTVDQHSDTTAITKVTTVLDSGHNSIDDQTGKGDSTIVTGMLKSATEVSVTGGSNTASVPSCGCSSHPLNLEIEDNGAGSHNTVENVAVVTTKYKQKTDTFALTDVYTKLTSGHNKISDGTGKGDSTILTGKGWQVTSVTVTGGSNSLNSH